jgi:hypothetical protein
VAGSCEHSNEPLGSIKDGETSWLAEWLSASQEGLCCVELVQHCLLSVKLGDFYVLMIQISPQMSTASRAALGPTRPPIQWVPVYLSSGMNRLGHEADHSVPSSVEVRNAWSYTSTPHMSSWRGASLSTEYVSFFMDMWVTCLRDYINSTLYNPRRPPLPSTLKQ